MTNLKEKYLYKIIRSVTRKTNGVKYDIFLEYLPLLIKYMDDWATPLYFDMCHIFYY